MTALSQTIPAQAGMLESLLSLNLDDAVQRLRPSRRIWLVGTGSSQHAAELGAWMFASGDMEARWSSSAAFAWAEPGLTDDDAVVIISHTAETAFARRVRAGALRAGVCVVSITGRGRGWPEAVETVPVERSETYTASYLAALLVLARLAAELGQSDFDERQLFELPDRVRNAAGAPVALATPPERLTILVGSGPGAVTAREGALKLREAARLPAEGYEANICSTARPFRCERVTRSSRSSRRTIDSGCWSGSPPPPPARDSQSRPCRKPMGFIPCWRRSH
jgi:glutamine---fructose-6-phosphate transaminase (isomerizing)